MKSTVKVQRSPAYLVLQLAVLAVGVMALFWLPVIYWATYEPSGDERDGPLLFPGLLFCIVACLLSPGLYLCAWRRSREMPQHQLSICAASSALLLISFSPLLLISYRLLTLVGKK